MSWIGAAINVAGGLLGGNSAAGAAGDTSAAQLEATRQAAEAAKFRPVGITTRFGSSNFQMSPEGYLTGAGYQLSPEMQALQDQIMGYTRQGLGDIGTLQNLGRGYLAQTPDQAAANWMQRQQAILQPSRDLQRAQLMNSMFNKGTGGLSVAQGGGLQAANPEMQAYYNALAQQDLQLAAQAQEQGQNQTTFGLGLLSSAYQPFQTGLGTSSTLEDLGLNALTIGSQLGSKSAASGAQAGKLLLEGTNAAATNMLKAGSYDPLSSLLLGIGGSKDLTGAVSKGISNLFS